jgi:hypothetical protein
MGSRRGAVIAIAASCSLHGGLAWAITCMPRARGEAPYTIELLDDDHSEVAPLRAPTPRPTVTVASSDHPNCDPTRAPGAVDPVVPPPFIDSAALRPAAPSRSIGSAGRGNGRRASAPDAATSSATVGSPAATAGGAAADAMDVPALPTSAPTGANEQSALPQSSEATVAMADGSAPPSDTTATTDSALDAPDPGSSAVVGHSDADANAARERPPETLPETVPPSPTVIAIEASAAQEMNTATFSGPLLPLEAFVGRRLAVEVAVTIELQAGDSREASSSFSYGWTIRIAGRVAGSGAFGGDPEHGRGSILRFAASTVRTELEPEVAPTIEIDVYPIADWTFRHAGDPRDRARLYAGTIQVTPL